MMTKNKIFVGILTSVVLLSNISGVAAATNKETLLNNISVLDTNLANLKLNKTKDLETKLAALSKEYDDAITSLGYDVKTLNYLVALGKISGNSKNELISEFIVLKNEINSKTTQEVLTLSSLKDKIQYQFPTVTDAENTSLSAELKKITDNYNLANTTFTTSLNNLEAKYKANLATYKMMLKSSLDTNKTQVDTVRNFQNTYDTLYSSKTEFDKMYADFKTSYLSYAGELTVFNNEKQKFYNNAITQYLSGITQKNIQANPSLEKYRNDILKQNALLVEKFSTSLKDHVAQNYELLYSDVDISSLEIRFNTVKNRYYDLNGGIQASEVLSSSGALTEIIFLRDKYSEMNTKIKTLVGDNVSQNTFSNLKIRIENAMVKFYNESYPKYESDLLLILKEKLDLAILENKNVILAADSIDIRNTIFTEKLNKTKDLTTITKLTSDFKKDLEKYSYLSSQAIEFKSKRLLNNAYKYSIDVELANVKYKKYLSRYANYNKQLQAIFPQMEKKFPKSYITRLENLVTKLDALLTNKLSDKNRYQVLAIKKIVIEYLNTQYK